jgi:hypothetical protein
MKCLWAAAAAVMLLLDMALPVVADGIGPDSYNFLNPPAYLRSTNQQPSNGSGTIGLSSGGSQSQLVATQDGQAALQYPAGAIPLMAGQSAVRVLIAPVGKYPTPPTTSAGFHNLTIQGNVYAFREMYAPSGKPVSRLLKPVEMTLLFPNTPDVLLGTNGGPWFQLCSLKNLDRAANSLSCAVRSVPREVIMLRRSNLTNTVTTSNVIIFILGTGSIVLALVVMAWVAYRNFVRKPRPTGPSGSPPPSPPPMNRAERRRRR